MDWYRIDIGLADRCWIGITWQLNGLAIDWQSIGTGLTLDWHRIGGIGDELALDEIGRHLIGTGLVPDCHRIDVRLGWIGT